MYRGFGRRGCWSFCKQTKDAKKVPNGKILKLWYPIAVRVKLVDIYCQFLAKNQRGLSSSEPSLGSNQILTSSRTYKTKYIFCNNLSCFRPQVNFVSNKDNRNFLGKDVDTSYLSSLDWYWSGNRESLP